MEESVLGSVVRLEFIVTDVVSVGVLFVFSVEVIVIGPIVHDPNSISGNLVEVILH